MKKVIILGAGGSTKVLLDMFKKDRIKLQVVGILDDDLKLLHKRFCGVPVLGTTNDLPKFKKRFDEVLIGVGATKDTDARSALYDRVIKAGFKLASVISAAAYVAPSAKLGQGVIVMPLALVNAGATLEDNVFINSGTLVEHDSYIGQSSFLSPGVVTSGYTVVGRNTFIGGGTCIRGKVTIGFNVTVGLGSVIVKDIPNSVVCSGNPAHRNIQKKASS